MSSILEFLIELWATINSLSDKKVILHIEPAGAAIKLETDVSMKFNIGTEVYFIKAPIKSYLNNYYFDFSATVIQLKRRREPRYQIPKKWSQTAFLLNFRPDMRTVNCIVHDISLSGIRLEILNPLITLDDGLKVSICRWA